MTAAGGCDLAKASAFRLGALEVRPPTREVIGAAGAALLEPRVMQVLVTLAGRRGEVVSRNELIDDCWAGRAVGDDAINRCIQAIRKLADSHGGFSILTVARVGYRLDEAGSPAAAAPPPAAAPAPPAVTHIPEASERRHLNILSCALARPAGAGLDPESWYAIAAEWRALAIAATSRFGGHVESAHGDRLIAAFGYPEAHEDAAERAVRAGLAVVEQMALLNARLGETHGIALSVAAGVHAGVAVVARRGDGGVELFGEALDLALRVEAQAGANAVLITGPVLDMVAGQLVVEGQGALEGGVALHRVRSAGLAGERRPRGDDCDFVGREEELALLASRWARVRQDTGQLVLVHGEPGIGKSRLVEAFRTRIAAEPHLWIECRGEQLYANTALHASAQMLWKGLGWRGDESPEERAAALARALERSELKLAEALPLIAELLGLPVPDHFRPLLLAPEQRRRRLLAALADWLFGATRSQPVVLVIEDLHWLDPSSLELLHRLAEQGSGVPLLLLCTARPEFRATWPARSHHIQIALGGLAPGEIRTLVTGLSAERSLGGDAVDAIVDRADGIPLFAEALARLVGEQGEAEIPATLMDSLAARLDRLGEAREVARIGAVIGRSFSWALLRSLSDESDEALQAGLERLAEAGLILVRGAPPDATYRFRHALIRDAAYGMLLGGQRRDWHRRVAEAIAGRVVAAEPEELAHHWTEANEAERAIAAWAAAGAVAYARHAFAEAASAYRRALAVLASLPDTPARDARELDLTAALSLALVPTEGAQAPEVAAIAERRHALAQRSGNLRALVTATTYAFLAAHFHSEWDQAEQLADQVADLARHVASDTRPETLAYGLAMGHFCHAVAFFYRGELAEAEAHFHAWEELNRDRQYDERGVIVMAYATAALLAWHMGDLAEVERRIACAWEHARAVDNPFEFCCCLTIETLMNVHRRDPAAVEAAAGQALALARERNFAQFEAWAGASLGWARAHSGAPAEGVAMIREGLSLLAKIQSRLSMPWFLTMLGEAQGLAGDAAGAFDSFEQALTICPQERIHRPIGLIARGEMSARTGDTARAEASLREAIATAELMRAAAPKQRAATALARLRRA